MSPAPNAPHDAAEASETGVHDPPPRDSVRDMADRERRSRGLPLRGDLMRQARIDHGWTQAEAAEAIGVGPRGYQVWEQNGRDARAEAGNIAKIAQVFEIPREELLASDAPVTVLSEVERLALIEERLQSLSGEIKRARRQLKDLDAVVKDQLEELNTSVQELLGATVADLEARSESAPGSSRSRTNG